MMENKIKQISFVIIFLMIGFNISQVASSVSTAPASDMIIVTLDDPNDVTIQDALNILLE